MASTFMDWAISLACEIEVQSVCIVSRLGIDHIGAILLYFLFKNSISLPQVMHSGSKELCKNLAFKQCSCLFFFFQLKEKKRPHVTHCVTQAGFDFASWMWPRTCEPAACVRVVALSGAPPRLVLWGAWAWDQTQGFLHQTQEHPANSHIPIVFHSSQIPFLSHALFIF